MNEHDDMRQDWPSDPDNDELQRLAEQLASAAPPLPADSLARVHQRVQAELDRTQRPRFRTSASLGWSIAAAILLAVSGYTYLRLQSSPDKLPLAHEPALIEDRITVAIGEPARANVADKPLVPLDDYRSLFSD